MVSVDGTYDDGEAASDMIRANDALSRPNRAARLSEGDKVQFNYQGRGKWYPGKIVRDRGDGTYDISYDDGDSEIRVFSDMIRANVSQPSPNISNSEIKSSSSRTLEENTGDVDVNNLAIDRIDLRTLKELDMTSVKGHTVRQLMEVLSISEEIAIELSKRTSSYEGAVEYYMQNPTLFSQDRPADLPG